MSLAAGPGRGGARVAGAASASTAGDDTDQLPAEIQLVVDNHVRYIQSLDTVRASDSPMLGRVANTCCSVETNWSIG